MDLHQHRQHSPQMPPAFPTAEFAQPSFSPSTLANLYDRDVFAWATENARLLQERKFDELDLTNLIDEVQDMAKSEQRSIFSHLVNLLMHLLKWQHQPAIQSRSWQLSITNARIAIERLLEESPSLQDSPRQNLDKAYKDAKRFASQETGLALKAFPEACPYSIEQVLGDDWLPN